MDGLTPPTTRADKHGVMYVFAETDSAMRYPLHGCAAIASQLSPVRGAPPSLVLLSLLFFFFFFTAVVHAAQCMARALTQTK